MQSILLFRFDFITDIIIIILIYFFFFFFGLVDIRKKYK